MKKLLAFLGAWAAAVAVSAQDRIRVEAPNMVGLDEQFNVTFIIEGEEKPSNFQWSEGADFQLIWGPQKGTSTSIRIVNGTRTKSSQYTFTYILSPKQAGRFQLPQATATVDGKEIVSPSAGIEVVTNASSGSGPGGASSGRASGSAGGSSGTDPAASDAARTGEIASEDLFMRFSVSRTRAVIGEPVTATLKLYQRVNIAGFEDARFPSFNGFWSQQTFAPTNIEFKRESFDDKIYNTAVLRSWVLIPQQAGSLRIDPAELVCLVNVRAPSRRSSSIFDSFFEDDYRTVRKRVTTPAVTVEVRSLPSGAPASFGGGVGTFSLSARIGKDSLKTHDASSLFVTVSGKGNVSLLEAPKVSFPPDFDVYDVKTTENTDKSAGGTSGSKTFEYPFIPRSHGTFTLDPITYSYYDVNAGKYVTLTTPPLTVKVAKGAVSQESAAPGGTLPAVDRKGVRTLGEDIRFIRTRRPASLSAKGGFLVTRPLYWVAAALLLLLALGAWLLLRRMAARRADVAGTRGRRATRMAMNRLRKAEEFLRKDLYAAFYEELHKALLGFVSDKLGMKAEDLGKENIAARLTEGGADPGKVQAFIDLLDACEYARYAPDGGTVAMSGHYDTAVEVISAIDSSMKHHKPSAGGAAALSALLLLGLPLAGGAAERLDSLWNAGVVAYEAGLWDEARIAWETLAAEGIESAELQYNIGNAWYKAGHTPRAILGYERALKLDPSFSDARYNLAFAQNLIQDKIDPVPEFILTSLLRKVRDVFPSNTWAILSLVLLAGALAMLLLFLLSPSSGARRTGFFTGIVLLLLCLGTFGLARWEARGYVRSDSAIVMVPVSSVKSSPSAQSSKDLFVLHEGTRVKVLDCVGDWTNVELPDGRQGWMRTADFEVI